MSDHLQGTPCCWYYESIFIHIFVMGSVKHVFLKQSATVRNGHPRWLIWHQSKGACDFLLVINSNLGPILHPFWDTVTYVRKTPIFSILLSFNALARGEPFRNSASGESYTGKTICRWRFRDPNLRCFDTVPAWRMTQTDGRTCRRQHSKLYTDALLKLKIDRKFTRHVCLGD